MTEHPTTVDDYIASLPDEIGRVVERVRQAIRVALPHAEERVRYPGGGDPCRDAPGFRAVRKR